ncbi:Peptidase A31, hydrogen uptake protein [mine drainage metagenome]|uniref:Peptidase A31, hydrogen uptake protein n=1 Tax=mine drainage metagenome TaxID=410659 RepID=T1AJI0_9ZZZZ
MTAPHPTGRPAVGPLVIGLGNDLRRDDACGLEVARRLRDRVGGAARIVECDGEVGHLLDLWNGVDWVVVVDAVRSGGTPGTVLRLALPSDRVGGTARGTGSTHGLSLGEAVGLAEALGRRPPRVEVVGIEGTDFALGSGLSPAVEAAVEQVVERLAVELGGGSATSA